MELCQYPCQTRTRYFTIEAIEIPMVYNQYGDYDPDGLLYVLEEDAERIKETYIPYEINFDHNIFTPAF